MPHQEIKFRINALKQLLTNTDYKAIKASEGHPSEDWEVVSAKREAWREEINQLEDKLAEISDEDTQHE